MGQGADRQRLLAAYTVVQQGAARLEAQQRAAFGLSNQLNEGRGQMVTRFAPATGRVTVDCPTASQIDSRLHLFDAVPSTNQMVWELMNQGDQKPIAIALIQTAGRGQWGRQWQSDLGGLYLSVGLRIAMPATHAAEFTLCTAWGIATALRHIPAQLSGVTADLPVQLKWPNDLVLKGRKLGGILTETRVQQQQITRAVIGVGLNWTNPVPETGINLQEFLSNHPTPLIESLEMLAAIALHGIFTGVCYQQMGRMDEILPAYLDLLAHRDRPIQWQGKEWTITGVEPTGALRMRPKFSESVSHSNIEPNSEAEILIQPGTISLGYPL